MRKSPKKIGKTSVFRDFVKPVCGAGFAVAGLSAPVTPS